MKSSTAVMNNSYPLFDQYFTEEEAIYYRDLFAEHGLAPVLYNPTNEYYSAIAARQNDFQFTLTLPQEQFEKANALIEKEVEKKGVPEDYYLRDFDDTQLREILVNVYEWSRQDIAAAAILLRERNVTVYSNQLQGQKEAKRLEIKKKEGRISLPVLLIMYITALLGGFATLAGGAFVYFATAVNPEGIRDYVFIQDYRLHGLAVMVISGVMIITFFSLSFIGINPHLPRMFFAPYELL